VNDGNKPLCSIGQRYVSEHFFSGRDGACVFSLLHNRPLENQGASIVGWTINTFHMIISIYAIANAN
jgi:hypothetical protein